MKSMKPAITLVPVLAALTSWSCQSPTEDPFTSASEQAPPPGASYEGPAFTFHEVTEDVYHAIGTGNLAVGCNAAIVINESDVLVVDSHISPAAAWALAEELRNVTDKPIRYVINTHFHFDHAHGNQIYPSDVEVVSHELTREKIASGASTSGRSYESYIGALPDREKELERELEAARGSGTEEEIAELTRALEIHRAYMAATGAVVPTPPTVTLSERMTLFRGGREIQLLFFGRGHTGGDLVVFLPEERVLATGDLLGSNLSYMGDGYLDEWADTLEELKSLEFDVVLPGHGPAFRDRERIDYFQAYLRDLWQKLQKAHADGLSVTEAAESIDMTPHAEHYPSITGPGVHPHAVARAYALIEGTEQ